jgi:outer membrane immunogenic protein
MKKLLFAGVAVAALCCAPALAADIPVKAPVYKAAAAPIFDWTGPYAGIAAGWGWGHSKQTDPGIEEEIGDGSYRLRGGLIGGTLGYNWQRGPWVFGLEADYS